MFGLPAKEKKIKSARFHLGRRYHGHLVYQTEDEYGLIEIIESTKERSLHFGGAEKQSSCLLATPSHLLLRYTQMMMLSLMMREKKPEKILLLGLGGGSIAKFLLQHYPDAELDIVELRPKVVEVAKSHFGLQESPRVQYWLGDARDFMKSSFEGKYSHIYVDLFDQEGMSFAARQFGFYQSLYRFLQPQGILSMNLWEDPPSLYQAVVSYARQSFGEDLYFAAVTNRTNVILFGIKESEHETAKPEYEDWFIRAEALQSKTGLPSLQDLDSFIEENGMAIFE